MAKDPEFAEIAKRNDFKSFREVVIKKRKAGVLTEDIAETIIAEVETRIAAGDMAGADGLLFHAVHAGIRPSLLFTECRKAYEYKEA